MKTKFLGQAYASRSPILASQTAINIYPEKTEGNSEEVGAFYGTPGLVTQFFAVTGEVRGIYTAADKNMYAVIAQYVYRIFPGYHFQLLGIIPNNVGRVSIIDNGFQVAFAHSGGMHWVSYTGLSIAPTTNAPINAVMGTLDQYVVFTTSVGGEWGITALADLSSINPLDVATAEGAPDDLVSVICDHREVVLFGMDTTEIWSDTGAALFPFERSPGGFTEQGCAAKRSPCKIDNSVFWLARDRNGQGMVYRNNAYLPIRISTHAVEYAINQYEDISDAIGISYQEEGHSFYWLIFPSGDSSWCYDVATGGWHQRLWRDPTSGLLHRPRANCYTFFNGKHLVGDFENGKIYALDLNVGTDDGLDIYRERAFELPDAENKRVRMDMVELGAMVGDEQLLLPNGAFQFGDYQPIAFQAAVHTLAPPIVWLSVSRDNGQRFGYQRIKTMSSTGQSMARVRWRRCGTGRNVVLKIATTMANRVHWVWCNMMGEALDQ